MKKIIILFSILLIFSPSILFAENNIDMWQFEKEILLKDDLGYKAIILDEDIYRNSNNNLSDIRIINQKNEFIPYYIETQYNNLEKQVRENYYEAKSILTFTKKNDSFFDFKLINKDSNSDFIVNKLNLDIDLSENFSKNIAVYGSYDNEKWDFITEDNIFNILSENKSNTQVILPEDLKYSYYRISILGNIEDVKIDALSGIKLQKDIINNIDYINKKELEYKISNESNNTIITIGNPNKLKIFQIEILTNDLFARDYELYLGNDLYLQSGSINNKPKGNIIEFHGDFVRNIGEDINITIFNKDDKPISIDNIKSSYYIDKLVFKAESANDYSLIYGNEMASRPSYDIVSYKSTIENEKQEFLEFGKLIEKSIIQSDSKKLDIKPILNIIVIITSFLLTFFIVKHVFKKE